MKIPEDILRQFNPKKVTYNKGDYIFEIDQTPKYYYQIMSGGVKMCFYNENGNEFIQGIFGPGKSFGEPPLISGLKYPAHAIAISKVELLIITRESFEELLKKHDDLHWLLTKTLSKRLYFKAKMANGITSNSAENSILSLFNYLKKDVLNSDIPFETKIDLTRKNIAGLTGLSVETTIRKIKKLEGETKLKIINGDVYY